MNLNFFSNAFDPMGFEDELGGDFFSDTFDPAEFENEFENGVNNDFFSDAFDPMGFESGLTNLVDAPQEIVQEDEIEANDMQGEGFMTGQIFSLSDVQYVASPDSRYLLKANVGDRKSIKGVTYVLNDNHRWAREDGSHFQPHDYPVLRRQLTRDRNVEGLRNLGEQASESQNYEDSDFWAESGEEDEAYDLADSLESGRGRKALTPKKAKRQITTLLNQGDEDGLADLAEMLEGLAGEHEGTALGDDYYTLATQAEELSLEIFESKKTPEELEAEERRFNDSMNQVKSDWENLQSEVDKLKKVVQSRYEAWQQSQQSLRESSKILNENEQLTPEDIDNVQKLQLAYTIADQQVNELDEQIKTQQEQLKSLFTGGYESSWKPVEQELQRLKFGF